MKKILSLLIFLWIIFAFFNVLYNTQKSFSEIKEWGFLSDSEKRHKIFGDIYNFIIFIDTNTKNNAQVLIFSDNDMMYLLSRYYLYPRLVNITNNKKELNILISSGKYLYVASY